MFEDNEEQELIDEEPLLDAFFIPEMKTKLAEGKEPAIEELEDFRLTRYEYSKVISKRVEQLAKGYPTELKLDSRRRISLPEVAKRELEQGLMPLKILREFPSRKKIQVLKLYGKKIREADVV